MGILLSEKLKKRRKSEGVFSFIDNKNIFIIFGVFFGLIISIVGLIFIFFKFYFIVNFDRFFSTLYDYNNENIIIEGFSDLELVGDLDSYNFKGLKHQENFLKDKLNNVKINSEEVQKNLVGKLNNALPDTLEKEFIITFFEDLFLTISSKKSPVVLNSVDIGSPSSNNLDIGNNDKLVYKKYPISLGFSCSDYEFNRILDIIQVSGLFEKKYYFRGEILPVMTVSSVSMDFNKNSEDNKDYKDVVKSRSLQFFMYSFGDKKSEIKK